MITGEYLKLLGGNGFSLKTFLIVVGVLFGLAFIVAGIVYIKQHFYIAKNDQYNKSGNVSFKPENNESESLKNGLGEQNRFEHKSETLEKISGNCQKCHSTAQDTKPILKGQLKARHSTKFDEPARILKEQPLIFSRGAVFGDCFKEISQEKGMDYLTAIKFLDCPNSQVYAHVFKDDDDFDDIDEWGASPYYHISSIGEICGGDCCGIPVTLDRIKIISDYHLLASFNKEFKEFADEELTKFIGKMEVKKLCPQISGSEVAEYSTLVFVSIKNPQKYPLLLLLSVYKNVYDFDNFAETLDYFKANSALIKIYYYGSKKYFHDLTLYRYCSEKQAVDFSGWEADEFDPDGIGL